MASLEATRLRKGNLIKVGNDLLRVMDVQHMTPGNKRGFVQARLRNIRTRNLSDLKLRAEEDVERAVLDEHEMQYLYSDGDAFHFMNTETFEQIRLHKSVVGDRASYLVPDITLRLEFYEGRPVDIALPPTVDLKVVETEPSMKGASATNVMKPAKLETGLVVQVPPFISEGERIRVDTSEGTYLERAG